MAACGCRIDRGGFGWLILTFGLVWGGIRAYVCSIVFYGLRIVWGWVIFIVCLGMMYAFTNKFTLYGLLDLIFSGHCRQVSPVPPDLPFSSFPVLPPWREWLSFLVSSRSYVTSWTICASSWVGYPTGSLFICSNFQYLNSL